MDHRPVQPTVLQPQRNYQDYSLDITNRDLHGNRVDRLVETIVSINLLDLYPIVTTIDKIILDGQHRLSAAKAVPTPFYALSGGDISIEDIAEANLHTFRYDSKDALLLYSAIGGESYRYLRNFLEKYPFLGLLQAARLLDGPITTAGFHDGSFAIRRPNYADLVARRIQDFMSVAKWVGSSKLRETVANLTQNPAYEHARMISRLRAAPYKLKKVANQEDAMIMMTEIYNYNVNRSRHAILKSVWGNEFPNSLDRNTEPIAVGPKTYKRALSGQQTVEVWQTANLAMFRRHENARQVHDQRLKALIRFMKRRNLLAYYPILVDKDFVILDGQRRWLAACELHVPISYIVSHNFNLRLASLASGRSDRWGLPDYLRHFCGSEYAEYQELEQFRRQYRYIALGSAISFLAYQKDDNVIDDYKSGRFQIRDREFATRFAKLLGHIENSPLRQNAVFQRTFFAGLHDGRFDGDRFVRQYNRYPDIMGTFHDRDSCKEQIERVYNYRQPSTLRITFAEEWEDGHKIW
jgi:hypothetical protein